MTVNKQLFLYPIEHNNGFIDRTKGVFTKLGYRPVALKRLFRPGNIASRSKNTVVLNWYEDQPFRKGLSGVKRLVFILGFLVSLLSMRLFSHNIIWLRHNFKPHNVSHKTALFSLIESMMKAVSHRVVTLEMTDEMESCVVKHPLYKPDADLTEFFTQTVNRPRTTDFLYFGSIKPYKRLDALMKIWPVGVPLKIMGYCSDQAHTDEINRIVEQRNLTVDWQNAFIEQDELEQAVADTRFVIIPHEDGAMISSGTFYMALSLGANVLCFDSAFARTKAREFEFVQILDQQNINDQLPGLSYTSAGLVVEQAVNRYGDEAIKESWRVVLSK